MERTDLLDMMTTLKLYGGSATEFWPRVLTDFGPPSVPQRTVPPVWRGAWSGLERESGIVRAAPSGA